MPGLLLFICSDSIMAQEPGNVEKAAVTMELQEWKIIATSPGVKIVSETLGNPGEVLSESDGRTPKRAAEDWLADQKPGLYEGRNFLDNDRLVYISVGSAAINATPSEPNYIDSRFLAFQRAELEAKTKIALFLGVDLTTERGSGEREIDPQARAALEELVNTSPTLRKNVETIGIKQDIYSLFKKTTQLAGAKLDKALEESGVDIAGDKSRTEREHAQEKAKENRRLQLRRISDASLKAAASAFADVQGAQVVQAFEGSYHGNYQVAVITVWSSNLQRLVEAMTKGTAPKGLSRKAAKEKVVKQLPEDPKEMACLVGVRAYTNEDGETVLLSFGQSAVQVFGGREDKAYELAGNKARLRAMAAIRMFMGEKIAFTMSEELREALALYADEYAAESDDFGAQEYKSISQFQNKIEAVSKKQKITGLHGLVTRELKHPFTGRPMVLEVMAWSPSSQNIAIETKRAIEQGVGKETSGKQPVRKKEEIETRKGLISSGKGADKSDW